MPRLSSRRSSPRGSASYGVFTGRPGALSNDFFVNLLDSSTAWSKSSQAESVHEGRDRETGTLSWTTTPVDRVFGSHSKPRVVAEVYGANDGREKFGKDCVAPRPLSVPVYGAHRILPIQARAATHYITVPDSPRTEHER